MQASMSTYTRQVAHVRDVYHCRPATFIHVRQALLGRHRAAAAIASAEIGCSSCTGAAAAAWYAACTAVALQGWCVNRGSCLGCCSNCQPLGCCLNCCCLARVVCHLVAPTALAKATTAWRERQAGRRLTLSRCTLTLKEKSMPAP